MATPTGPARGALGSFVDGAGARRTPAGQLRRWDGAARTSYAWDGLRRDPELWLRNGNCLVHLYGKGQSRRGPSFKVPFKELLAKKCFPLIERFLVTEGPAPRTPGQLRVWANDPRRVFELYIPAPPNATKEQAYVYHVATRNFFAFIYRRSMVGEYLGHALVGLLYSLHEFRADVLDNVAEMTDYMDEEGYLDLIDQPIHALALMHLGEVFQLRDIYIRAFAHCVGMSERLHDCPGYQHLGRATRKMVRQSRTDLDERLYKATDMLNDFLDDSLSESNLGIPIGARSHMERFRSFLMSFYTSRFGYYPPRSFTPDMLRTMRHEFEALYNLLVDETYTASQMPWVASGGICIFQLVQMFDKNQTYDPLEHPLPLLPQFDQKASSRRIAWRPRSDRLKLDEKLLAHAAIVKASNWRDKTLHNDLITAYRTFEEETIFSPNKADRQDKVSVLDARKVRWILIYAVYQVLRSVTTVPEEVFDAQEAPYHLAVPTDVITWSDSTPDLQGLLRRQTDLAIETDLTSPSIHWADSAGASNHTGTIEIKPDIDYFALNHRTPPPEERCSSAMGTSHSSTSLARSASTVSRALSRKSTVRRSWRMFRPASITPPQEGLPPSKPAHHEILVQGYGNGLNSVQLGGEKDVPETTWVRNNSTASNSSSSGESPESTSSNDTIESSVPTPTAATTPYSVYSLNPPSPTKSKSQRREVVSMFLQPSPSITLKRPKSTNFLTTTSTNNADNYSSDYEALVEEQRQSFFGDGSYSPERQRESPKQQDTFRRHGKQVSLQPHIVVEDDWAAMQAFMEKQDSPVESQDSHAWAQYSDLGGFRRA